MTSVDYWFHQDTPNIKDIIMCTVESYGDAGYKVTLDGYGDREGFIPLCELSQKRIRKNPATFLKIGDKHPVQVMSIAKDDSHVVEVSLKDVDAAEQEKCQKNSMCTVKLYNMCQRLEHISGLPEALWRGAFKDSISKTRSGASLFEAIHIEQQLLTGKVDLPKNLTEILITHHRHLFGFSATTVQKNYIIQCFRSDGNEYVKHVLLDVCPIDQTVWSIEELNNDSTRFNLSVKLIGLPKILITTTAGNRAAAEEAQRVAEAKLKAANFNILMEV
jgi:translation initiation factor 2 alpha subunit (eIF-2alpha)